MKMAVQFEEYLSNFFRNVLNLNEDTNDEANEDFKQLLVLFSNIKKYRLNVPL